MPITSKTSERKPEVVLQYGGNLLLETGNSIISAADRATLWKFSMQIDFDVPNCSTSSKRKPEVDFDAMAAILKIAKT